MVVVVEHLDLADQHAEVASKDFHERHAGRQRILFSLAGRSKRFVSRAPARPIRGFAKAGSPVVELVLALQLATLPVAVVTLELQLHIAAVNRDRATGRSAAPTIMRGDIVHGGVPAHQASDALDRTGFVCEHVCESISNLVERSELSGDCDFVCQRWAVSKHILLRDFVPNRENHLLSLNLSRR